MTSVGKFRSEGTVEIKLALPDKFLWVLRQQVTSATNANQALNVAEYVGFNGDQPIRETVAPYGGAAGFETPVPKTPEEKAAARAALAASGKRLFVQIALPLFATAPAAYPLQFTSGGQADLAFEKEADVIVAKGPDGRQWKLYLDTTSHLPTAVMWQARPLLLSYRAGSVPIGGPQESQPLVWWQAVFSNYAVTNGLNWPRQITSSYPAGAGAKAYSEQLKITKVSINPKFGAETFKPSK
jgi:hypothetical protein